MTSLKGGKIVANVTNLRAISIIIICTIIFVLLIRILYKQMTPRYMKTKNFEFLYDNETPIADGWAAMPIKNSHCYIKNVKSMFFE